MKMTTPSKNDVKCFGSFLTYLLTYPNQISSDVARPTYLPTPKSDVIYEYSLSILIPILINTNPNPNSNFNSNPDSNFDSVFDISGWTVLFCLLEICYVWPPTSILEALWLMSASTGTITSCRSGWDQEPFKTWFPEIPLTFLVIGVLSKPRISASLSLLKPDLMLWLMTASD